MKPLMKRNRKSMRWHPPVVLFLLLVGAAAQQVPPPVFAKGPEFRDAATHRDLAKVHQRVERGDPMSKLTAAEGFDPSRVAPPEDFVKSSDILCFNGMATFVPKRAILASPGPLKGRLGLQPGARVVPWREFLENNRGWIGTIEVDRAQAEGNKAFPEEVAESISKSSRLLVATYQGGPISVLPLKAVQAAEASPVNPAKP